MATADKLFKENNVPENLRMLQRVMVKLKQDSLSLQAKPNLMTICNHTYLDRAAKYTGLQTEVLKSIKNSEEYDIEDFKEVDRSVIYEELATFYLKVKMLPTTKQLFEALYKKIPPYLDIRYFRKILVNMGFVWKRKNRRGPSCVVIERPTITFERYEYLKNIINYRNDGKPIYFIEEYALASNGEYLTQEQSRLYSKTNPETSQQRVVYAVSKTGVHFVRFINSFDEEAFTGWLLSGLLPHIENPSIIVFDKSKHHCEQIIEPPNKESLKIEICKWLEYHKIPYSEELTKYELLNLTENFTDVEENMYNIDRIVKNNGHWVLRIPDCIKKLTPATLLCNLIKENKEIFVNSETMNEEIFAEAVGSIPMENFFTYDEYIAKHEMNIYNKDLDIDKVFDGLLNNITYLPATDDYDTEIPSCSDSE